MNLADIQKSVEATLVHNGAKPLFYAMQHYMCLNYTVHDPKKSKAEIQTRSSAQFASISTANVDVVQTSTFFVYNVSVRINILGNIESDIHARIADLYNLYISDNYNVEYTKSFGRIYEQATIGVTQKQLVRASLIRQLISTGIKIVPTLTNLVTISFVYLDLEFVILSTKGLSISGQNIGLVLNTRDTWKNYMGEIQYAQFIPGVTKGTTLPSIEGGTFTTTQCPPNSSRIDTFCRCDAGLSGIGDSFLECQRCPHGFYCPGAGVQKPCPKAVALNGVETPLPADLRLGLTKIEDCMCPRLFYIDIAPDKTSGACRACPRAVGNDGIEVPLPSTLGPGLVNIGQCECPPKFFKNTTAGGKQAQCVPCPSAVLPNGQSVEIPSTPTDRFTHRDQCQCPATFYKTQGNTPSGAACYACPRAITKHGVEVSLPLSLSDKLTSLQQCLCPPTFYKNTSLNGQYASCVPCPVAIDYNGTEIPPLSTPSDRFTSIEQCVCPPRFFLTANKISNAGECVACPRAFEASGAEVPIPSSVNDRFKSIDQCQCPPRFFKGIDQATSLVSCILCPRAIEPVTQQEVAIPSSPSDRFTSVEQCQCPPTFVKVQTSSSLGSECLPCPRAIDAGNMQVPLPSKPTDRFTSMSQCQCPPKFYMNSSDSPGHMACEPCPKAIAHNGQLVPIPFTENDRFTHIEECSCPSDFYLSVSTQRCIPCPRAILRNGTEVSLPINTKSRLTSLDECVCPPKFYLTRDQGGKCAQCPIALNHLQQEVDIPFDPSQRLTSIDQCRCPSQFYKQNGLCNLCPIAQDKAGKVYPVAYSPSVQLTSIQQCRCPPQFYSKIASCILCPPGFYCSDGVLLVTCGDNSWSPEGSFKQEQCTCKPGFTPATPPAQGCVPCEQCESLVAIEFSFSDLIIPTGYTQESVATGLASTIATRDGAVANIESVYAKYTYTKTLSVTEAAGIWKSAYVQRLQDAIAKDANVPLSDIVCTSPILIFSAPSSDSIALEAFVDKITKRLSTSRRRLLQTALQSFELKLPESLSSDFDFEQEIKLGLGSIPAASMVISFNTTVSTGSVLDTTVLKESVKTRFDSLMDEGQPVPLYTTSGVTSQVLNDGNVIVAVRVQNPGAPAEILVDEARQDTQKARLISSFTKSPDLRTNVIFSSASTTKLLVEDKSTHTCVSYAIKDPIRGFDCVCVNGTKCYPDPSGKDRGCVAGKNYYCSPVPEDGKVIPLAILYALALALLITFIICGYFIYQYMKTRSYKAIPVATTSCTNQYCLHTNSHCTR